MQDIILRKIDYLTNTDFIYNKLPSRMIYLRDQQELSIDADKFYTAWYRLKQVQEYKSLIFTDIYRSPANSAEAYARKTGVAKPGYSGHNYGVSVDVAIDASLKRHNISYPELVNIMIAFGWTPFQGVLFDSSYKRGSEDWHFNFIGDFAYHDFSARIIKPGADQINKWINANIQFNTDLISIQKMLTSLKFYHGEFDGVSGPLTIEAIKKFKSAWYPKKLLSFGLSGKLDELTIRLINIVSTRVVDTENNIII